MGALTAQTNAALSPETAERSALAGLAWPDIPTATVDAIFTAARYTDGLKEWGPTSNFDAQDLDAAGRVLALPLHETALSGLAERLQQAIATPPNRKATIALLGLLFDAFPAGRPANFTVYANSMAYDLERQGFGPAIVAMGCQTIRSTSRFLPTIAEVVAACQAAKEELEARRFRADRVLKIRARARRMAESPLRVAAT